MYHTLYGQKFIWIELKGTSLTSTALIVKWPANSPEPWVKIQQKAVPEASMYACTVMCKS